MLAGFGFDHTVAGSASSTNKNPEGDTLDSTSSSIDGSIFTLQLWLGVGGYL